MLLLFKPKNLNFNALLHYKIFKSQFIFNQMKLSH